jgi:hypothetical protein
MTAAVTGWISKATPPLVDRPGTYEVQSGGRYGPVRKQQWTGTRWVNQYIGAVYGDRWRGLAQPAKG